MHATETDPSMEMGRQTSIESCEFYPMSLCRHALVVGNPKRRC